MTTAPGQATVSCSQKMLNKLLAAQLKEVVSAQSTEASTKGCDNSASGNSTWHGGKRHAEDDSSTPSCTGSSGALGEFGVRLATLGQGRVALLFVVSLLVFAAVDGRCSVHFCRKLCCRGTSYSCRVVV